MKLCLSPVIGRFSFKLKSIWPGFLIAGAVFLTQENNANASITGVFGLETNSWNLVCPNNDYHYNTQAYDLDNYAVLQQAEPCYYQLDASVPHSGYYRAYTYVLSMSRSMLASVTTPATYIDSHKSLMQQSISFGYTPSVYFTHPKADMYVCGFLLDEEGNKYNLSTNLSSVCTGGQPLPPPVPDTACTLNSGNDLTVSLGLIERSALPVNPDPATAKSVQIPVDCTGGDVTVSMKLDYNPMTMGGGQAVRTSTDGVGVVISYNDIPISTTDTTTLTFLEGSNTLDLNFQAVRDSAVNVADIPTGGFTASAAVVMTQQ